MNANFLIRNLGNYVTANNCPVHASAALFHGTVSVCSKHRLELMLHMLLVQRTL